LINVTLSLDNLKEFLIIFENLGLLFLLLFSRHGPFAQVGSLFARMDGVTLIVDDVVDHAIAVKEDTEGVVHFDTSLLWDFDTAFHVDGIVSEE